jgi:hypothetical protein
MFKRLTGATVQESWLRILYSVWSSVLCVEPWGFNTTSKLAYP